MQIISLLIYQSPVESSIKVGKMENIISAPRSVSRLEELLGPNGPTEATESVLQPLDPHDVKALRATCKAIRSNRLLTRVEADPFHRRLLQGFCYWDNRRAPERSPEDPPVLCMKSHKDEEPIYLCETHPVDLPFPVCFEHSDESWPEFRDTHISILFGHCEGCEKMLWDTKASGQQRCQCGEWIDRNVYDKLRCGACAMYSTAKMVAISNGRKCEECFPPFVVWYQADSSLDCQEYKIWENNYPSGPCVEKHQPLTAERNKSCQVCKCLLSKDRYLTLCEDKENTKFFKLACWRPSMTNNFLWCGVEGCGKLLNDPWEDCECETSESGSALVPEPHGRQLGRLIA